MRRTAAAALIALIAVALHATAHASTLKTFVVNATADDDDATPGDGMCATSSDVCTFRAALEEANAKRDTNVIDFGVAGTGPFTIGVSGGGWPTIKHRVIIDGYSQPGAAPNTLPAVQDGTNATVSIFLDGSPPTDDNEALIFDTGSSGSVVKGLAFGNWGFGAIHEIGHATGVKVLGCFVGTDASGTTAAPNGFAAAVQSPAHHLVLGGTHPADRNIIANSQGTAVQLGGSGGSVIEGNLIGVTADATTPAANGTASTQPGIQVFSGSNLIKGNVIENSSGPGVYVFGTSPKPVHNRILRNTFFDNGGLAIDLAGGTEMNGVTSNDQGDTDGGPNHLQNFPVLTSASASAAKITGVLGSHPDRSYVIQFFNASSRDPSGFGEGANFLGQITVRTNRHGRSAFSFKREGLSGPAVVTATATDVSMRETSEFSEAIDVTP